MGVSPISILFACATAQHWHSTRGGSAGTLLILTSQRPACILQSQAGAAYLDKRLVPLSWHTACTMAHRSLCRGLRNIPVVEPLLSGSCADNLPAGSIPVGRSCHHTVTPASKRADRPDDSGSRLTHFAP